MDKEEKCTCGCGHDHNSDDCCTEHEHKTMTILTDENEELKCSVLGIFDVEDKKYIALLPMENNEILIYRFVLYEDDSFELFHIETDEEFDKVEDAFYEVFGDDDDFDDNDFE